MRITFSKYDKMVELKDLKASRFQRNKHSPEQIERLAMLMLEHGVRHPIHISKLTGEVCFGHGRWAAALFNKWSEYPVIYQDFKDETEEYSCVQSDNGIALWAELDLGQINTDIQSLGPDFDVDLLGIKDFEIEPADKFKGDEDEVPDAHKEAVSKLGDLYELGRHRLLCGDSTDKAQVERLMGGEKADMVFTDPPYGVSYTSKNEYLNSLGTGHRLTKTIENDEKTPEEMYEFWCSAFSNLCQFSSDKMSYYITAPQGGDLLLLLLLQAVRQSGFQLKHVLVWAKNNHVLGRCDYHYKHEPIVYGWKQKGTHTFYGKGQMGTSVWNFNKPLKNDLHPTMKPVELIQEAILNSSTKDEKIMDSFGGSGSTLIACEKTNRKCFMMEIDPHYVDVIVARWEKYTGLKAKLIEEKQ